MVLTNLGGDIMSLEELSRAFSGLNEIERRKLTDGAVRRSFTSGSTVIEEGQQTDGLMIIAKGVIRLTKGDANSPLAEFASPLGPGEVVGEMSYVDGATASATLVADGDVEVLKIEEPIIDALVEADPAFAGRFYHSLLINTVRRLRAANRRIVLPYT